MVKPLHTRVTFEGHVGPSASAIIERWSFSLNSPDNAAVSGASDAVLSNTAEGLHGGWVTHMAPVFPGNCYLDKVTVAALDGDGLYRVRGDGSYIKGEHTESVGGAMADNQMPLQIALCVSLVTARSGPTGKGRFFLPWPSLSVDVNDRLIPVSQMNDFIDNVAAFLGVYNDWPGMNLSVVSSKGYSSDVTGIRIGRAPDTIRSRREELDEGYVTASVPQ